MNWFILIICLYSFISTTKALDEKPGEVEIIPYINKTANNEFEVILHFVIEKDWYIYWKNPGDSGIPTKFEWNLPAGIELASDDWEIPVIFPYDEFACIGYKGETRFKFIFHSDFELNNNISLDCNVSWLICKEGCYPGFDTISIQMKNSDFIGTSMAFLNSNQGLYPNKVDAIKSQGFIKNEKLYFNINEAPMDLKNIKSLIFITENPGFLSTTQQNYKIEENKIIMEVGLDELRESNPKVLDGLINIEDLNNIRTAYKVNIHIN